MSKINKSFLTDGFSLGADEPEITGGFRRKENIITPRLITAQTQHSRSVRVELTQV